MRLLRLTLGACLLASVVSFPAAATVTSGTIIGVFGGRSTAGYVLNNPALGQSTFYFNNGTSVSSVANSTNPATAGNPALQTTGSALNWGDNNGGGGQASTLNFFGATIPADVDQSFRIGRLTYVNGTSTLPSLIFGATISFYANSVSAQNFLGTDTISISTTSNLGVSTAQDADYINICGNQSNVCGTSINAVESSQGGTGVTVDLFGTIVGDPQLFVDMVQLAPGQSSATNGFLAADPPIGLLPEPASLTLLAFSLVPLAFARRGARSR